MGRYKTILLFGPPGSGKGTQGKILSSIPGFFHSACGDVFRRLNVNSDLGRQVIEYSSKGELVPDDTTIKIWTRQLDAMVTLGAFKPESDLLILDGIPRTVKQAEILEDTLEVLRVLHLVCPDEEAMVERLRLRAVKENRIDDMKESVIRHRWEVYKQESMPVLEYYPKKLIVKIDASHSPAAVLAHVLQISAPIQEAHFQAMT